MKNDKLEKAIPKQTALGIYDFLGKRYDWLGGFDARAKEHAFGLLGAMAGHRLLEIGVGTGKEHSRLQAAVLPGGTLFGFDISRVMLNLARQQSHSQLCQADAHKPPFVSGFFDNIYISYVLDLLPKADIPGI